MTAAAAARQWELPSSASPVLGTKKHKSNRQGRLRATRPCSTAVTGEVPSTPSMQDKDSAGNCNSREQKEGYSNQLTVFRAAQHVGVCRGEGTV